MNYLAHLALSYSDPARAVGNFIADGLRPADKRLLPEAILKGVHLHYFIDDFVDHHPAFKRNLLLLKASQGKYAPVTLDIIYDHILALQWYDHFEISYSHFSEWVYSSLSEHKHLLHGKARKRVEDLLDYKYLEAYRHIAGLKDVLRRMDARSRFPSNFQGAIEIVKASKLEFSIGFKELFVDVKEIILKKDSMSGK